MIEPYKQILINEESKLDLFKQIKFMCETNKNTVSHELLSYLDSAEILTDDRFTTKDVIAIMLYAAIITYHIPIYGSVEGSTQKALHTRALTNTWIGARVFNFSFLDENAVYEYSHSATSILPPLKHVDTNHNLLISEPGKQAADLCNINNSADTYEVKFNYFEKHSPSSLHKAKKLVNCLPSNTLELYNIVNGTVDMESKQTVNNIIFATREKHFKPTYINYNDWEILRTGSLIIELDSYLQSQGIIFKWNK